MIKMRPFSIVLSTIAILGTLSFIPLCVSDEEWIQVRSGKAYGISGIAWIEDHQNTIECLIVHDNKSDYPERLARVSLTNQGQSNYFPLNWSDNTEHPHDLESLVAVPDQNDRFIALNSQGKIYDLKFVSQTQTIDILQTFDLPDLPENSNFEGFALTQIQDQLIAVWAHRGEGEDPAILYWGAFDLDQGFISPVTHQEIRVPLPTENPRHISDVKIDRTGQIWISSATDPGDNGPFNSAIYRIGHFQINENTIALHLNSQLTPTAVYEGHKIEAIEFLPESNGTQILGTDDENFGGFVRIDRFSES